MTGGMRLDRVRFRERSAINGGGSYRGTAGDSPAPARGTVFDPGPGTRPPEDPHGHPRPTAEGLLAQRNLQSLIKFAAGDRVVIREVRDDNPERLRRWQALGLTPGTRVRIHSHQPLVGLFEVQIGDKVVVLGAEGLAGLSGEVVPLPDEQPPAQ